MRLKLGPGRTATTDASSNGEEPIRLTMTVYPWDSSCLMVCSALLGPLGAAAAGPADPTMAATATPTAAATIRDLPNVFRTGLPSSTLLVTLPDTGKNQQLRRFSSDGRN